MKFSTKGFLSKGDQICSFLRIWSLLLKQSLMENFIFSVVFGLQDGWCELETCHGVRAVQIIFFIYA